MHEQILLVSFALAVCLHQLVYRAFLTFSIALLACSRVWCLSIFCYKDLDSIKKPGEHCVSALCKLE